MPPEPPTAPTRDITTIDPRPAGDADPFVGTTVAGRYRVLRVIGEGGYGLVYEAEQSAPVRRRVALKVLKPGMGTRAILARFEAERQALAVMDHPCVAKVLDAGETDRGLPFFVMELVKGEFITTFCDHHRFGIEQRIELMIRVSHAVQHAHSKGVIHRDLKPSNILVGYDGDGHALPKVIDFGIAKALNQRLSEHTIITEHGQPIGTPEYMSPEQAEMSGTDIDTRSDVYSLGVLLYELLTGVRPFDLRRIAAHEIPRMIREVEPAKPSTRLGMLFSGGDSESATRIIGFRRTEARILKRALRRDLDWVIMKCLEKDRERRYDTANALAGELKRYLDGEVVQAGRPSAVYRFRKFVRRNKGPVAATTAVSMALVLGIVGTTIGLLRARDEAARGKLEAIAARSAEAGRVLERDQRAAAERMIEYNRYVAHIQLAHAAFEQRMLRRTRHRLDACPRQHRGWEWYWLDARFVGRLSRFDQHTDYPVSVSFSPDGTRAVSASNDLTARVWDPATGELFHTLIGHTGGVRAASFSADGLRIVTGSDDRTARVWDAVTGNALRTLAGHAGSVLSASFSPDGTRIVTASRDRTARVWDTENWRVIHVLDRHDGEITSASFSPNRPVILTTSRDQTAKLWDAVTGEFLRSVDHAGEIGSASFSPDGSRFVTAAADRTAQVWDAATGDRLGILALHSGMVQQACFSPDGSWIVTVADGAVRVWDAFTWESLPEIFGLPDRIGSFAISGDGSRIATVSQEKAVQVWETIAEGSAGEFIRNLGRIRSFAFSPDGRKAVTLTHDNTARVWNFVFREPILELGGHVSSLTSVSFSPDGKRILAASRDNVARVWDAASGSQLAEFAGHTRSVVSASFCPDGARVITASYDGTARIWDAAGNQVARLHGHAGEVVDASFSPDRRHVATASWDRSARIWDARSGEQVHLLHGHAGELSSVAYSLDGERLVTTSRDRTARIWDPKTGALLASLDGHTAEVNSARFSPDGTRVATASGDQTISVWDASTGERLVELTGHTERVVVVLFSPDGTRIISASEDGAVRVWDAVPYRIRAEEFRDYARGMNGYARVEAWMSEVGFPRPSRVAP